MTKYLQGAFLLFAAFTPLSASAVFSDVNSTHPYSTAIDYVEQKGIVNGYNDRTYKPNNQINRAEFTKIIVEAVMTDETINACLNEVHGDLFPDVEEDAWFAKYICIAKRERMVRGYGDGTFRPGANINMAEAAKIVSQAFNFEISLSDTWYQPFIDAIVGRSLIEEHFFVPSKNLTRGEMAHIIYHLHAEIEELTHGSANRPVEEEPEPEEEEEVVEDNAPKTHEASAALERVNAERTKDGLPLMTYNLMLEEAAIKHAADMHDREYFSHITPEGLSDEDRIRATGYLEVDFATCDCTSWSGAIGENIGFGQETVVDVMIDWLNSPPHKATILSRGFDEIGLGRKANVWVMTFGKITTK